MLVVLRIVGVAVVVGVTGGWWMFQSRFGGVVEFGPFDSRYELAVSDVASASRSPSGASPRVEVVAGEEHDFGVMEPGAEGTHAFVIRNAGDAPLELRNLGSTCKCTIGELEQPKLQPGEQTEVRLSWVARTDIEEFSQSATIGTNDPRNSEFRLRIRGRVISSMTMVPRNLSFGDIASGDQVELESVIYSYSKTPIVPVDQVFNLPELQQRTTFSIEEVSVESTENPTYADATQAFRVRAVVAPGLSQGAIRATYTFTFAPASAAEDAAGGEIDSDLISRFEAEASGKVVGVITLVESRRVVNTDQGYVISMGHVDPANDPPLRCNILLRGPDRDAIKLSIGEVDPAGVLQAELGEPIGRSTTRLIPLMLSIAPDAGPIDRKGLGLDDWGVVRLEAEGPESSSLRLRVRFSVE